MSASGFTIGQFVERTGVAEGTLRMWERRHGFPSPDRLPSGHRRYREADVESVRRVAAERAAGMSLASAIGRVRANSAAPVQSVFAALRRRRPGLEPRTLRKPMLLALTRAVEDESLSRAERPLLFASFQSERFYRQEQRRWRQLSRGAELTVALADFGRSRAPRGGPVEIPLGGEHPLAREWVLVCWAPDHAACLVGWEAPAHARLPDHLRTFETIWSVEPEVVLDAARVCAEIVSSRAPELIDQVRGRLESDPSPPTEAQLRLATAVTNRTLAYLS